MAKRKISAKEILRDLQDGIGENAIMAKHGLSPSQLKAILNKLESAGLLSDIERTKEPEEPSPKPSATHVCPACGMPQDHEFDECPQCGVIVSKYLGPDEPYSVADQHIADASSNKSLAKNLLAGVIAVAAIVLLGALAIWLWPSGSADKGPSAGAAGPNVTSPQGNTARPREFREDVEAGRELGEALNMSDRHVKGGALGKARRGMKAKKDQVLQDMHDAMSDADSLGFDKAMQNRQSDRELHQEE